MEFRAQPNDDPRTTRHALLTHLSCLAAGAMTTPVVVAAVVQSASATPAVNDAELKPEQVRAAYLNAGHLVSKPIAFDDGVVTFSVSHPSDALQQHPVLRVLVYTSTAVAVAAHQQASGRNEADRSGALADSDDRGPRLLTGYGLSVWRQNVSIIQAAPADDIGAWAVEVDCENISSQQVVPPRTIVEPQYVAPLQALRDLPPRAGI
jgi:hypothetical protein